MPLRLATRALLALRIEDAVRRSSDARATHASLDVEIEGLAAEIAAAETNLDYDEALSEAREWAAVVLARTARRIG